MKYDKLFTTIDTHTGGNPTRSLISGMPALEGETMSEKMLYMQKNYDWIRKFLMNEPRGHGVMSGVIITDPCHPDADLGVIYIETGGYLPMCGHDTIGVCTALVESQLIPVVEPFTQVTLDTPAGLVDVNIRVEKGIAKEVTFKNVPSFFLKNVVIEDIEYGTVEVEVAYGGNFYGIIDARKLGLQLTVDNATKIINVGIRLRNAINAKEEIVHPEYPFIHGLTHMEFYTDPENPQAHLKNTVVVPPGGIDRSPCGTGTSAKVATLYKKGKLQLNEPFLYESIVGTIFTAQILEEVEVPGVQAIIPQVSGSAWVMGMHRFYYNEEDPLREGYLMIPPMDH
ncbi:proline racemase [Solibacillus silvestris]|uniref:proline racemase family protein n=1 Tax=Solibacillus sp. FSL K6-1126 TaxID=2921463 RepID=UPI0007FB3089|nr:proline racemase family protein [Solibacillus silvestris]OBW58849.1 proline racemase [Solibacillus silvestris]